MVEKLRFYHATWTGNVPSIKEGGIISRTHSTCEQMVDKILAEFGETRESVPEYYWSFPLLRCKETVSHVYLSGDPDYAICNCLAGFEAETDLRSHLEARKVKRKFRYLPTEEALKREMPCSVCEVKLNRDDLPKEQMEEFEHRAERAARFMSGKFPSKEAALDYILSKTTITLPQVPPEKIDRCEFVGSRDYIEKCELFRTGNEP